MTIHVIGHSRGLGEYLYNNFKKEFKDVRGYSKTNGYDIEKDLTKICHNVEVDDIVILNAYANGAQEAYLEMLTKYRIRTVVMGSIAAIFPDISNIEYSKNKKDLEDYFTNISAESKIPLLYLRLTGSSYDDYQLIYDSIKFWLSNPRVTMLGYSVL